jgi:hypothetical protein
MSGFQFAHVDGYGRKGGINAKTKQRVFSMREIVAEAERHNDAVPHIPDPKPPLLLFGVSPSEAAADAEAWAETAKDAKGRKLRIDGMCMNAGVVSFPADRMDEWPDYRNDAVDWLKKKYGEQLKSVVEHTDEPYPHIHFYVVPEKGARFGSVHEGYDAMDKVPKESPRIDKKNAFSAAMSAFQDEIYHSFGMKYGLSRTGPRRQRLSRGEWKKQQAAAAKNAELMQFAKSLKNDAEQRAAEVEKITHAAEERAKHIEWQAEEQAKHVERQAEERAKHIERQAEERAKHIERQAEERAKHVERQAEEKRKSAEELRHRFNRQVIELQKKAGSMKRVPLLKKEIDAVIDALDPEHKSGLLRKEDLYTRDEVKQIAGEAALSAIQKQFDAQQNFTAATALAIARAKTQIDAETASELNSLRNRVVELSEDNAKKDLKIADQHRTYNEQRTTIRNAAERVRGVDATVAKAEAKASEQERRADRLAHELNAAEDENRALKERLGIASPHRKMGL